MRSRVGVAAGQNIDRGLGGVHGHVEFPVVHTVGDHCPHAQAAAARGQLDQASAPNAALRGQFRRDLDERVRRLFLDAGLR